MEGRVFANGFLLVLSCLCTILWHPRASGMGSRPVVNGCETIYDFESDAELDGLEYQCHTWFELDRRHASSGLKSLRVEMYPQASYPGVNFKDLKGPWQGVTRIRLDMFNPGSEVVDVTFRIDDRAAPPYSDRVNHRVVLGPGWNQVELDLSALVTSGTKRHLDTGRIGRFMFFTHGIERPVTIFVDNIRLCKEQ